MTKEIQEKLAKPFSAEDIEWRIQRFGLYPSAKGDKAGWALVLAYVTNRAIMDRLDEVVGIGNWKNEYSQAPDGGVLCGLSIRIGDEWVTKYDGAENTNIAAVKGGLSGAMKRAAVQWGIGRYLYKLDENFVQLSDDKNWGSFTVYDKSMKSKLYWRAPKLPEWALPEVK